MTSFRIECINDLAAAKTWWERFSPRKTLYDIWEFRYCFYKPFQYELFFYVGYVGNEPIGLLALQYNSRHELFEPFGGSFMSNIQVFCDEKHSKYVPNFYAAIPSPAVLTDIVGCDPFTMSLPFSNYRYILDLTAIKSGEEYLEKCVNSKFRSNVKRRVKLMEETGIQVTRNNFTDIDKLIELNVKTFPDSSFNKPHRPEIFRDLLRQNFNTELLSFSIDGKVVAVCLAFVFNGIYLNINMGADKSVSPHLWTYVTFYKLRHAIELGCRQFDYGMEDCSWKEHWGHGKLPEYKFYKPAVVTLPQPTTTTV